MNSIIDILKSRNFFVCERGATTTEIENAQNELGLSFAEDYRTYIQEFGSASYEGHELTGISKDLNLNVVTVTNRNRQRNHSIDKSLYVVEETHIDGIVIWQAPDQKIYQTEMDTEPVQIAESLAEYIQLI